MFKDYKWGDKFKISKISYKDGIQDYKCGDDTANIVYINQNNMYIVDKEQVENIYNKIKNFEIYSFEGETIIDPSYDIGDLLIIEGKKVIYQGESEYAGKFKANIKSKIQAKTEQESMQTKQTNSNKIKRVQSEINQIDGKIKQLVQENAEHEEKITQVEQDVDGITQKVENIVDTTRSVSGLKTIKLEKCIKGYLIKLRILGNNAVFKRLYPDDDLYPANTLYPLGDSRIIVTDADGNSKMYELRVPDVLRANEETQDEYILENNFAKVIRRVNEDGTTKVTPEEVVIGKYTIYVAQGDNTITIQNYNASIEAVFVQQNAYTDQFATKVEMTSAIQQSVEQVQSKVNKTLKDNYSTTQEMESTITQTAEEINTEVRKKVGEDEIITKINQSAEAVAIQANKISLNGKTFDLSTENLKIASSYLTIDNEGKIRLKGRYAYNKYIPFEIFTDNYRGILDMHSNQINLHDSDSDLSIYMSMPDTTKGAGHTILGAVGVTNSAGTAEIAADSDESTPPTITVFNNILQQGASISYNHFSIPNGEITAQAINAYEYKNRSLEKLKKNIELYNNNALETINNAHVYEYNYKFENDNDKKHIGFVIGKKYKTPNVIISSSNDSIELYSTLSVMWKAIQELNEKNNILEKRLEKYENG